MKKINQEIEDQIKSSSLLLESAKKRIVDCVNKNNFGKGFRATSERVSSYFFLVDTLNDYLLENKDINLSVSDLEVKIKDLDMFILGMLNNITDPSVALELSGYIKVNNILSQIKLLNS
jgi:hypothetical protein